MPKKPIVAYVQFTNPAHYPPLEHSARILSRNGWELIFLGFTSGAQDVIAFDPSDQFGIHLLRCRWKRVPAKVYYVFYLLWVIARLVRLRPNVIYCSDVYSAPIGLLACFFSRVRVVYHEHDSVDSQSRRLSVFMEFLIWTRNALARLCSANVLPNVVRTEHFRTVTRSSRPIVCIWNCPRTEEALFEEPKLDTFTVFYHGSIVPNRFPVALIEAFATIPQDSQLVFAGYDTIGSPRHSTRLVQEAIRLGIGDRVKYLGTIPHRSELLRHCKLSTVGISFMPMEGGDANEINMAGASNKPFDYLACGVPLLVSALTDWEDLFVRPGFGRACDPRYPDSIAKSLLWFYEHRSEAQIMGALGRDRILKDWNYETQFAPILTLLDK